MNIVRIFTIIMACATVTSATRTKMMQECTGSARYKVTFYNMITNQRFSEVPENGLVFSPMTAVTHSPRVSLLTVRGFASSPVEEVCETGSNANLIATANASGMVSTVVSAEGPVMSGGNYTIEVTATCAYPYLTVLSMIAPSPDWIVQISNMPLMKYGKFIHKRAGYLIAYDCGTDSGRDFTNPADTSLDIPTDPALNIAPLREDETDRFGYMAVGFYKIEKIEIM